MITSFPEAALMISIAATIWQIYEWCSAYTINCSTKMTTWCAIILRTSQKSITLCTKRLMAVTKNALIRYKSTHILSRQQGWKNKFS
jgi:hypothetical protein